MARLRDRLPPNVPVSLEVGDALTLGKYTLTIEKTTAPAVEDWLEEAGGRKDRSPFAPQAGAGDFSGLSRPSIPDPFASPERRSPLDVGRLLSDPAPAQSSGRLAVQTGDVWSQRPVARAGDWNAPPPGRAPSHDKLIGSPIGWVEPKATPPQDLEFGFDAPFHKPILRAEPIVREALLIPSNWDIDPPAPARGLVDPFNEPPPAARLADLPPIPPQEPVQASSPVLKNPPLRPTPFEQPAPPPERRPAVKAAVGGASEDLLRAFCLGADLDPAEFGNEDPEAVMRRAGAIYRQMVLGLGDLLSERTTLKNEYRMSRTTVAAEGNNPFKWAPARRVGVDLLRNSNDGFLSGPPAVREACEDLKKHLLCLLAGMRASVSSTLRALDPAIVETQISGHHYIMKSKKGAAAWSEYAKIYSDFCKQADDNPDSQVNRDFRSAYEHQLGELDGLSSRD